MTIQNNYPAIKPTLNLDFANTKQLDPRITYSRASTGTYYDGKAVAKAEENLFVQSQFVSGWGSSNVSQTANATTAADGTTTALSIIANTTSSVSHSIVQTTGATSGNTYTYSVYAKANGYTNVQLFGDSSGNFTATFDLVAATAAYLGSAIAATIVAVGNGWYRCSTTFVMSGPSRLNIQGFPAGATASNYGNTFTGDGTSGIYLWGAQLEQRSFATAYTPTTTAPITNYIPVLQTASAGTPRFDHNPITGESLGLLIEEQRTNLVTYSSDFNNPAWSKSNATVTANTAIAPDGTLTADLIYPTTTGTLRGAYQAVTVSGGTYTATLYAKPSGMSFVRFIEFTGSTVAGTIDLTNGSVTNLLAGYTITSTDVGNNWRRIQITAATTAGTRYLQFAVVDGINTSTATANGTNGVLFWGAQLEAGAFATSYIPTVASQVTRAADSASMTGTNFSSWYNPSEGSFYQDLTSLGVNAVDRYSLIISATGSAGANSHNIRNYNGVQVAQSLVNSTVQGEVTLPPGVVAGVPIRLIYAYKTNDFAGVKNGGSVVVDTAGLVPTNLTRLDLLGDGCNHLKKLAYYPRRLTNTQIQALTS